ncbi:hypothetical protein OROHE_009134 [Orobanche hederae]
MQTVNWNELGQPIGKESTTLSHFIGSYARRHIPITCDNWRKKDWLTIKQALCDEVKETFLGIEEHKKKNSHAGELHRQFRTRLRALVKEKISNYSMEPPPLYAHFSSVAPYSKEFVENAVKEDFVRWRWTKKYKAGEKNPVVTRLDAWEYARRNADGIVDDPATIEILEGFHIKSFVGTRAYKYWNGCLLARLIPLEYYGRVRGMGWGVTKTSLQTVTSASELSKLKSDISFLKNEIKEIKSKGYIPGMPSGGSSHMDNFDMDDDVDGEHDNNRDDVSSEELPEIALSNLQMTAFSCGQYVGCFIEDVLRSGETSISVNFTRLRLKWSIFEIIG